MFLVLYIVFSNLMKMMIPYYQLYLLLGIIIWNVFDRATTMSLNCIVGRPQFIQKVYLPRWILPLSSNITAILMFLSEFAVFLIFMAYFRVAPSVYALLFFPLILILFLFSFGASLVVSALNVYMRDVQFIWRVLLQAGFFATPILYPIEIIPEKYRWIFLLNPMAGIIISMRNCIIYSTSVKIEDFIYMASTSLIVVAIGWLVFKYLEPRFAEEI